MRRETRKLYRKPGYHTEFGGTRWLSGPRIEIEHGRCGRVTVIYFWGKSCDPADTYYPIREAIYFYRSEIELLDRGNNPHILKDPARVRELRQIARATITKKLPVQGLIDRCMDFWPGLLDASVAEILS